jgi:hypothetical protein
MLLRFFLQNAELLRSFRQFNLLFSKHVSYFAVFLLLNIAAVFKSRHLHPKSFELIFSLIQIQFVFTFAFFGSLELVLKLGYGILKICDFEVFIDFLFNDCFLFFENIVVKGTNILEFALFF